MSKITKTALLLAALALPLTTAKAQVFNIFPIDHSWKYMASSTAICLNGTGWETVGFDDSSWPSGPGGFTGGENTPATLTSLAGLLNTTTLPAPTPSGGAPQYFRTHFNVATTVNLSLILSNRIDDQAVFYLNGTRVADYRHPTDPETCTPGGAGGDEATVWIVITLTPAQLAGIVVNGDNVLAVSDHQNAATSSDMVFCSILSGTTGAPPPTPAAIAFTNGTGVITFDTLPPSQQWATRTWAGANTGISDFAGLDAAAKTNDATTITTALFSGTLDPPTDNGAGIWSSAGFIATRPTGVAYSGIMATLTNATGGPINSLGIRYSFTVHLAGQAGPEQIPGQLVYYSTTGAPGSWTEIPELNDAVNDDIEGSYSKSADVTLGSPWALHGLLYILWVDDNAINLSPDFSYEIDNVQFVTLTPVPPTFAPNDPTNRTVVQCSSTTLSATLVAGTPTPTLQWFHNNSPIGGANSSSYTIANMTSADAGTYFLQAVNASGTSNSHTATITYAAAPAFAEVGALGTTNPLEIIISFNQAVDPNTVDSAAIGFTVSGGLSAISAAVTSGTNVTLTLDGATPRVDGVNYTINIDPGTVASQCTGAAVATGAHQIASQSFLVGIGDSWQYNQSGTDPGPTWIQTGFNDTAAPWQTGAGVFDGKNTGPRTTSGGSPVGTVLVLSNTSTAFGNNDLPTYNFRKHFTFPGSTAGGSLVARVICDDAAVIYINGQEAARVGGLTNGVAIPFAEYGGTNDNTHTWGSRTVGTPADITDTVNLPMTNVLAGDNVLAVELKQERNTSSDITMGLELIGTVPSFTPKLTFTRDPGFDDGDLTWSAGTLQYNTNLSRGSGWHTVPGAVSPYHIEFTPGPSLKTNMMFFRLME